jgi:hypothetical protein
LAENESEKDELVRELEAWLEKNWDPEITVGEWWERLGLAGWAAPTLPGDAYGRGLSRSDANRVAATIATHGALGAPSGLGLLLAAPTIAKHGTKEQIDTFARGIVTGQDAWCQLFSKPGAGSDLASLATKGEKDGDTWRFSGQKVWTSGGQIADYGMLLARTNPDYRGIFYLTAHDLSEPRSAVSLANPAPNAGCPVTSRSGKLELFSEVTIGLPGMASTYYNQGNSPAADWVIEQPAIGNGNLFELGNFQLAQVKNAEAGYFKTSNQSGFIDNPYNFKLGTMGLNGCYNTSGKGEIGSCPLNYSMIDTYNKAGQPSTTVVPTPGKQGFDVEWHNCGLYHGSGKAE